MRKHLLLIMLLICSCITLYGQRFPKERLLYNGDINKIINIVIMSDGYTLAELPKFKKDATAFMTYFISQSPFSCYKNYFNIYTVNVPSNQSGVKHPHTAPDCGNDLSVENPDNYFHSTMDYAGIHRLIVANDNIVNTTLNNNFPQWDIVLILVNSSKYGGAGGMFAVASTDSSASMVALHEIGHSFGILRDEYYPGADYMIDIANTSKESNPKLVRWKNWIDFNNTGVYQFSEDSTWNRPHQNCKMRNIRWEFCPFCNEQIIEMIHSITNAIYSYSPTLKNVDVIKNDKIPFAITTLKPIPNSLKISWMLDGSVIAKNVDSLLLDYTMLTKDIHVLVAAVIDTTASIRNLTHPKTHIYSVQWTINNLVTDISINTIQYKTIISAFPNPFYDTIMFSYTLEKESNIRVELLSINGVFIKTLINQNNILAGNYKKSVDVSSLNLLTGVYIIRYVIDGFSYSEQIIKK